MAVLPLAETYKNLRGQVVWSLLASDKAPQTIALLQRLLFDSERRVPESVLIKRLQEALEEFSEMETVPREASIEKLAQWRNNGYVIRSLLASDEEPHYELSGGAFDAISFISGQTEVRVAPTGSRLELLIHAIKKLCDDTDTNLKNRIARLENDKKRIERRIKDLKAGKVPAISEIEVHSQISDIVSMIENMDSDFIRVKNRFIELAQNVYTEILHGERFRGGVLEKVFAGYDSIQESDEGKTFTSFYKFLLQELRDQELNSLIDTLEGRKFWSDVDRRKKSSIAEITDNLATAAQETQREMTRLAGGLREFVRSKQYLQNRRMQELIQDVQKLSVELKEEEKVKPLYNVFTVTRPVATISSVGASRLYDVINEGAGEPLQMAPAGQLDLMALSERLAASEINYSFLKQTIEDALRTLEFVSIGELLKLYPAEQGIATVIGYIHLAVDKADRVPDKTEEAQWKNRFDQVIAGVMPLFYFTRECLDENGRMK